MLTELYALRVKWHLLLYMTFLPVKKLIDYFNFFVFLVFYVDVQGMDIRNIMLRGKGDRFLRYIDRSLEEACTLVRTLGEKYKNITRAHLLVNLKGYNLITQGCLQCEPQKNEYYRLL